MSKDGRYKKPDWQSSYPYNSQLDAIEALILSAGFHAYLTDCLSNWRRISS